MLQRTLILAKPDAIQRGLVGEILKRFENLGLKIVGMKMITPTEEQLGQHYANDEQMLTFTGEKTIEAAKKSGKTITETPLQIGERIRGWNIHGLKGKPVIAMIFEGHHAIKMGRKIVGHTSPHLAPPGTIRGDYSVDSYDAADADQRVTINLVHASGEPHEAEREIKVWFKPEEQFNYERKDWQVLHSQ